MLCRLGVSEAENLPAFMPERMSRTYYSKLAGESYGNEKKDHKHSYCKIAYDDSLCDEISYFGLSLESNAVEGLFFQLQAENSSRSIPRWQKMLGL